MFFRNFLKIILRFFCQKAIKKYQPFILAITGNTGKTSTKEAIFTLFEKKFSNVRETPKNFNTDIGVPLTILGLEDARRNIFKWLKNFIKASWLLIIDQKNFPRYFILEIAADKPGEIAYFVKFLPIDIGVVTIIGEYPVHLEFFPSRDRLIEEKANLVKGVKESGFIILNADDKDVMRMVSLAKKGVKTLSYGKNSQADLKFSDLEQELNTDKAIFKNKFEYQNQKYNLVLKNVIGENNVYAISAALICGIAIGISLEESIKIIKQNFKSFPGRMNLIRGIRNSWIVDDTYNASPAAYFNALKTIRQLNYSGKKILVLGDMAELGDKSDLIHQKVIVSAINFADIIICVGLKMKSAFEKNNQKTKFKGKYFTTEESQDALILLKDMIQRGDLIFVKGAQIMRMEKIVKNIMNNPEEAKKMLVRQEEHWLNK